MNRIIDELKSTRQVDQTVCRGCDEARAKKDIWRKPKKGGQSNDKESDLSYIVS